jgi:hypothetical protein
MSSYLVVFHGDGNKRNKMIDLSDDPCFKKPPTWGICRPPTRKSVSLGDYLFFIAYYKICRQYYFKGYFKVGDKISYDTALKRYNNRLNVIITNQRGHNQIKWRYKDLEKAYTNKYGTKIKSWLTVIKVKEGRFYQNPNDKHEIDNWKCRRIFHCDKKQFLNCINYDRCAKNNISLTNFSNYIVADKNDWFDLGPFWIDLPTLKKQTGFSLQITTPKGQHNVLKCDQYHDSFMNLINKHKSVIK